MKLYHRISKCFEVYEVLHLGQIKLVNCSQILYQVADQNSEAKFHVEIVRNERFIS